MKIATGNYVKGKFSQEELHHKNKKLLETIINVRIANVAMIQSKSGTKLISENKNIKQQKVTEIKIPKEPSFEEFLQNYKELSKFFYVLLIDDYLICYVPSTGQKRIQRLGGKEESLKSNIVSQETVWYLNIHLLSNTEEYISLIVNPNFTLDKLLQFLCNENYWEGEDVKKKKFFGSFGSNLNIPKLKKPKFIEQSKNFYSNLMNLLSMLGYNLEHSEDIKNRKFTSSQLSMISFAKRTINQYDSTSTFVSLTISSQTTVAQCFSSQEANESSLENPLQLFLYLSSNHSSSSLSLPSQQKDFNKTTIYLTEEMFTYLSSLILNQTQEDGNKDKEQTKKIISDITDSISLYFII